MTEFKTIRFEAHHSGTLNTNTDGGSGQTTLGYLPAIFALARTRKAYDPATASEAFQTDLAGLKRLAELCEQAEEYLVDGMGAVGELLARADEPSVTATNGAGWLVRGLADLYAEVLAVRGDAEHQARRMQP